MHGFGAESLTPKSKRGLCSRLERAQRPFFEHKEIALTSVSVKNSQRVFIKHAHIA